MFRTALQMLEFLKYSLVYRLSVAHEYYMGANAIIHLHNNFDLMKGAVALNFEWKK